HHHLCHYIWGIGGVNFGFTLTHMAKEFTHRFGISYSLYLSVFIHSFSNHWAGNGTWLGWERI
ncbi:hypothetical protein OFB65_26650, partial [Escherichia coli]|nr:hypothetical protein [Escherichia coli]